MSDRANVVIVTALWALCALHGRPAQAQDVRVAIGFGVDTASTPNRDVFSLWREYLTHRADSTTERSLWSAAERERWPQYDLLAPFVYQGFRDFTVAQLAPAPGLDSAFVIRTLIAAVSDSPPVARPIALYRVYAVREAGRWALANALPRLTRRWADATVGRLTFHYPPGQVFSLRVASRTSAFVDSLAQAFGLTPPAHIEYYFTDDLGATLAAAGLEFFPTGSDSVGGRSIPADNIVLVGSAQHGETYRHELSHLVLQSLVGPNTAGLVAEGLMTWTGGSEGLDYQKLMPALNAYLIEHPSLTLESLLASPPLRSGSLDVGYDGLAVICDMVHAHSGIAGIRAFLMTGRAPTAVVAATSRLIGVTPETLDRVWRARVGQLAVSARPN